MDRYVLFLVTDNLSDDCKVRVEEFVKKVLHTEVAATHRFSETYRVFTSFVSLAEDQDNGDVSSDQLATWKLHPSDWQEKALSLNSLLSEGCSCPSISDLILALHSLCDALHRSGPLVEVFWLRSDTFQTCDDDIELYGCIKRLQLWHNAIISIIVPSSSSGCHDNGPHHFDSLRPTILCLDEAVLTYDRPVWNGSIVITGSSRSVQLPGFRLDPCPVGEFLDVDSPADDLVRNKERLETRGESDVVLSSSMKFMASVDVSDVPIFYISSFSYKLSLTSRSSVLQQSDNFLNVLKNSRNTGYIIRLEYGLCPEETKGEERVAGRESKMRRSWSDFLQERDSNGYDDLSLSGEFERVVGCHSFLVCAVSPEDIPSRSPSYPSTPESKEVTFLAYRLRNPSELNGSSMHQLTMRSLEKNADERNILDLIDHLSSHGRSAVDHLENLPNFSTKVFGKLMRNLRQAQLLAIEKLAGQDETRTVSGADFSRVLSKVRTTFLESVLSEHSRKECRSTSNTMYELQRMPIPEYRMDPYQQPERQILILKASDSAQLAQSKSHSGTLATLSPPANNQVAVTLDATELLKYFNPDGSAVASDSLFKVPVKKRRQRLYHYDRGETRCLPWPDCSQTRYHDVYYNIAVSEDLEKKCQQLRSRLSRHETSSTFGPAQTFLLPAKAAEKERQKFPSFPGHQKVLDRRNSMTKIETKIQKCSTFDRSLSSRRASGETKASLGDVDSFMDSNSCDSNSQLLRRESRSQRNRRRLEEVIGEILETTHSIGPTDPLFNPCFKRLHAITEAFVRDLPTSRDLRENMAKIARSHVRQTVKFEKERQRRLLGNAKNSQK